MRFTIKLKLALAFTLMLCLAGAIGLLGISSLAGMNDRLNTVVDVSAAKVQLGQDVQRLTSDVSRFEKNIILAPTPEEMDAFAAEIAARRNEIRSTLDQLRKLANEEGLRQLADFDAAWEEYLGYNAQVRDFARLNSNTRARQISTDEARAASDEAEAALDNLIGVAERNANIDQAVVQLVIARLKQDVLSAVRAEKNLILARSEEEMRSYEAAAERFQADAEEKFARVEDAFAGEAGRDLARFRDAWDDYKNQSARVMQTSLENGNSKAFELSAGDGAKALERADAALERMVQANLAGLEADVAASDETYAGTRTLMITVLGAALVIGVGAALWIALGISSGLAKAVGLARTVSEGDLSTDVAVKTNDEVRDLVEALRSMQKKLREVVAGVSSNADNVASGSQQMASSAEELSQGATEQSASAEQASSAIEEMSANIRQSAENATKTAGMADKASAEARSSGEVVNRALSSIEEIADKIKIVQEIARQTDLLALNAAVEAARAGTYGKGFAVVASEVRKLAERSQNAASEINQLSADTLTLSKEAGDKLDGLVPEIEKTAELVREISASVREQNTGAEQINDAMQQLDTVIQQNAGASEEVASVSEELSAQAIQLRDMLTFFKLDEASSARPLAAVAAPAVGRSAAVRPPVKTTSGHGPRTSAPNDAAGKANGHGKTNGSEAGFALDLGEGDEGFEPYRAQAN